MKLWFQNGASISKWSFDFEMELRFRNGASISKSSFHFKMELRFQNGALISKWSFDFKMEFRFRNGTSISKSSFHFKMVFRFWNGKWDCGFKIEDFVNMLARNHVKKCKSGHWRELNRKDREMKDSLWHVGKRCLLSIYNMCCERRKWTKAAVSFLVVSIGYFWQMAFYLNYTW